MHLRRRNVRATLDHASERGRTMNRYHSPHHWVAVAIVVAAALFALSNVWGQTTGAGAMFQGRPAMAGAQGGTGAQAGPPQGGIGVQGNEAAERAIRRRPGASDNAMPQGKLEPTTDVADARREVRKPDNDNTVRDKDSGVQPKKDTGIAKGEGVIAKTKRAAKRIAQRARHGVSPIDSTTTAAETNR
jgi:hypothetical protein